MSAFLITPQAVIERLFQYIQRFVSVYFTTLPGGYTQKKVAILTEFYQYTNEYLSSLGVDYWISYGTLLGYYRERGILGHDIDVDYSAADDAFEKIWANRHKLNPKVKMFNTSANHRGPKLFFSYKGFDGDIYFYEKVDQELVPFLISSIPADMTPIPSKMIFPLQKTDFLDQKTNIPHETKECLEHCYGYIGTNAKFDKKTGYWYKK